MRFLVRNPPGETVTATKTFVDGRPVSQRTISVPKGEGPLEVNVVLPERDCEVSIIAENRHGASEPATVRLLWAGERAKDQFVSKPKLYVLAIGISSYKHEDLKLAFGAKDARDFAGAVLAQQGGLYGDIIIKRLTDDDASRDEILDGLDWIRRETASKDVAMVFLAGHGVNDSDGTYYFLPVNAESQQLLRGASVPFSAIKTTVESLAGKTILFVNTCHAGNVMGKRRSVTDINAFVNELASAENGAVVFSASTGRQYSLEDPVWANGAFTKALLEGLNGQADYTGTGRITVNMLDLYISERVKKPTNRKQPPTTAKPNTVPDFPIALKR